MEDLSRLSLDALRKEFIALGDELSTVAEARNAYLAEIEKRQRALDAKARVDTMDSEQKIALSDELQRDPDVSSANLVKALASAQAVTP